MTREQEDRVTPEQAGSQYDRNLFRFRKSTSQRPALSDAEEPALSATKGSPPHSAPPRSLVLVVGSFALAQVVLWSLIGLASVVAHADTGQSCPRVVINEVVTDPQQDWDDPSTGPSTRSGRRSGRRSAGGDSIPFNATPGAGSITSSDEWTELLNVSDRVLNLIDWRLVMTDTTPATEIVGTTTDAQTGRPVIADVQAASVYLDDVTEFRLVFPASDEAIQITVTAPGYQEWSIGIKPHISHSKVFATPIKLKPKHAGDQT